MERKSNLFFAICAIASANASGFTVNAATLEPVAAGYAVAVEDTQNSFGVVGAYRVAEYVCEHSEINAVGGWYDSESGKYYLDATVIFSDLESAKAFARANHQLAIFNLSTFEEIRL